MRKGPQHNTASLWHIVLELLTALFESIFLLNSTKKCQRDAGVFDCFAYGEIDTRRTYLLSQTAAPLLQGGTKPYGFNSPVGFIRIYAPK